MKTKHVFLGLALVAASQAQAFEIPKMAGHRAECSMTITKGSSAGKQLNFQFDFIGAQRFSERSYFNGSLLVRRDGAYSIQNGRLRLAYDSGNTYDRVMVELENGFELSVNGNQMICAYRR